MHFSCHKLQNLKGCTLILFQTQKQIVTRWLFPFSFAVLRSLRTTATTITWTSPTTIKVKDKRSDAGANNDHVCSLFFFHIFCLFFFLYPSSLFFLSFYFPFLKKKTKNKKLVLISFSFSVLFFFFWLLLSVSCAPFFHLSSFSFCTPLFSAPSFIISFSSCSSLFPLCFSHLFSFHLLWCIFFLAFISNLYYSFLCFLLFDPPPPFSSFIIFSAVLFSTLFFTSHELFPSPLFCSLLHYLSPLFKSFLFTFPFLLFSCLVSSLLFSTCLFSSLLVSFHLFSSPLLFLTHPQSASGVSVSVSP